MNNYILQNENALYYECGFSCDHAIFLKLGSEAFFITDARYTTEASEAIANATVLEGARGDLLKTARLLIRKSGIKSLCYNPAEWDVEAYAKLSETLRITFCKRPNFSQQKRMIKTKGELELLKKAAHFGKEAFEHFGVFLKQHGKGMDEKRAFFEAEAILKHHGALGISFEPIVAFGENAAKPHALPTCKTLQEDELILFDAGVKYERYCSDRTRTTCFNERLCFEKEQHFSDALKQKVYDTVLRAQEAALKAVRVGVKTNEIDKAAREVIDKAGFGSYFVHSTGHGVGLDIHELPIISARSKTVIEENMVFTIEPGIYLPKQFGVRIEDTIIVRNNGAEIMG
ncbi:M24 family metallopeptidase [Sulfurospirillum barnesii]|uniref:Xaa-Pro aminopeptidase n=1 Tax=Sulfurospirillum barnesii (strain ATCC 700032 / DSM 10660 / SES-3) TaxID=760154 RepID=I3XUL3_SULBS|nr:M24 family metallopeptidase [Sulfurospirillum barnesii]AFL67637.1 Xaa-Pro aminopeptidase [Sulfurospirillum barnesii SES-3]